MVCLKALSVEHRHPPPSPTRPAFSGCFTLSTGIFPKQLRSPLRRSCADAGLGLGSRGGVGRPRRLQGQAGAAATPAPAVS